MTTATRHPQTRLTAAEATATTVAVKEAPLEVLFNLAAASKVVLHGLSVERPMTLTMGGTGSRKALTTFLRKLGEQFTVTDHRITFDLIGKKCVVTFTLCFKGAK